MNNKSDSRRLAEAVANVVTTITEIIELRIRELAQATKAKEPVHGGINRVLDAEGWVSKRAASEHLKISFRSLDNWIKKGTIPYIRIARGLRFKLSEVDDAMNRRFGRESKY